MKKKLSIFVVVFAVCAVLCTVFCAKTNKIALAETTQAPAQTTSSLGYRYLSTKLDSAHIVNNAYNGEQIKIETLSDTLVSSLQVSVSDWTNISDFSIKRIVVNRVTSLGLGNFDDAGTQISTSASTFQFSTNGAYVVMFKHDGVQYGIYTTQNFERTVDLSKLQVQNGQLYSNLVYSDKTTNLLISSGQGSLSLNLPASYNTNLYSASLGLSGTISTNQEITLSVASATTSSTLDTISIDTFAVLPSIEFFAGDQAVPDVLSQVTDASVKDRSSVLYFNKDVTPRLSNQSDSFFASRFSFSYSPAEIGSRTWVAKIVPSAQNWNSTAIKSVSYEIHTNPNDYFAIKLGSSESPISFLSDNFLNGVNTFSTPYPVSISSENSISYEINGPQILVWVTAGGEASGPIVAAFALPYVQYPIATETTISLVQSGSTFSVSNSFDEVPVDIAIIDVAGNVFEYNDIFAGQTATENSFSFTISTPGNFTVVARYRDVELKTSVNNWNHRTISVNVEGPAITLQTSTGYIAENQITNSQVSVNCSATYKVFKNNVLLGEYSTASSFSETGYYVVECGNQSKSFSIISSTEGLPSYSVSEFENVIPTQIVLNSNNVALEGSYTILKSRGTYTITNQITNNIQIVVDGKTQTLQTTTEFSYNVNIQPIAFHVKINVDNGQKTSKDVYLKSIDASGNWTVSINRDGKITHYTRDQFTALSKKNRTFSKTGTYTLTIVDENGNQYQVMFEKYYKMNAGLIVLIVVLGLGLAIGVFFFFKIRFKTRVR